MNKLYKHLTLMCLLILITMKGESAITSIVLTPAAPTTMSTGLGYYLAGKAYTFTVNVIDPTATAWADITDVRITIANSTNIVVAINPSNTGANATTLNSGPVTSAASIGALDTWNNFTVTFVVTFLWNTAESAWAGGRLIRASAISSNTMNSDRFVSYGICSTVQVTNPAMTGEAADGMINGLHNSFNVTGGEVVYNIAGATSTDSVRTIADAAAGEIASVELRINAVNPGGTNDIDESDSILIDVPTAFSIADSITPRTVAFIVNMTSAGGPETCVNTTSLTFNSIRVTDITFFGGGGIDNDPSGYYRSTNLPGTQVRIDAVMNAGSGTMIGNTTIELRDTTDGNITTVVIPNGNSFGTALLNITAPGNYSVTVGAANTQTRSYEIYDVYGGSFGSGLGFGQYNNNPALIPQPAAHSINWDNEDPPGANTPTFTAEITIADPTTAGSMTVSWTPLTLIYPDEDFDQYKFYYKNSTETLWAVIDKTTTGYTAIMPDITTGTITISGLSPLTNYDYMISAVDIFGNEVLIADRITGLSATKPSSISINITDGITKYYDSSFLGDPDPAIAHRLRKANIRIDADIITSGNVASLVEIIIADNASDLPADWGTTGTNDDIRTGLFDTLPTIKTGPNTWTGYIPSEHPLMAVGQSIRMILKITYQSGIVYADYNSEEDEFSNDQEWRIYIYNEPGFTPWPARVLNNVITDKNPVAYPSYYLTDDAHVTITAYDIKGRAVSILLQDAFRKAGQNIKENGWRGTNKSNRKLGIGLYYIHIKADRISDGKTIINKFNKVVIAK